MSCSELNPMLAEWLEHSQDLLALPQEFAGHEILAPDTPHHKEVAKIVAFKYVQAVRTFRAVLLLVEAGDGTNSLILMRALFESLIDVAYLIENPRDVWRYLEESAELEDKLRQANIRYGPPPERDIGVKRPSPSQLRERFSALAAKDSSCPSWRRLSLKAKAEKTGYPDLVALYEIVYPTSSAYVHGASGILLDYLRGLQDTTPEFHITYDRTDTELEPSVGLSALIFLRLIAFLDALFQFGLRSRVEALHDIQLELSGRSFDKLVVRYAHNTGPQPDGTASAAPRG